MNKKMATAEIIVVEDNEHDADLTFRALRKRKHHTNAVHFEDGAEAMEAIFRHYDDQGSLNGKHVPHLIFLDLKLPGMGGKEMLKALKNNEKTRFIPVVMLTSSNQQRDVVECYQLGANAYLVKPLAFDEYIGAVSEAASFWIDRNYMPDAFS